jgi:hypothetical protein
MTIASNPDPTSRFPNQYCKTCGQGWPEFVKCKLRTADNETACDFTGEVSMTAEMEAIYQAFERGEVPAGTRPKAANVWEPPKKQLTAFDWGTLKKQGDNL